jgi:uncharacterized protein YifE (UPF0438 family)
MRNMALTQGTQKREKIVDGDVDGGTSDVLNNNKKLYAAIYEGSLETKVKNANLNLSISNTPTLPKKQETIKIQNWPKYMKNIQTSRRF